MFLKSVFDIYIFRNLLCLNNFVKIWDTSIDLSWYVTTTELNTALSNYTTTANLTTLLAQKQDVLTAWAWISIINNVISNTIPWATISNTAPSNPTQWTLWYDTVNDVLKSYDWSIWSEVWNESVDINTKTFHLSWTSDLTNAQAAYDWFSAWKNPIVMYNNRAYLIYAKNATQLIFQDIENSAYDQYSYTEYVWQKVIFTLSWNDVTAINYNSTSWWSWPILRTDVDYPTPYIPQYDWSPATKKYVDEHTWTTYTAWANIQISAQNVISATDTTYTAGTWISIDANNVISNTQTSAEWWSITWTLSNQTDLQNALDDKQDTLTAWTNIQISEQNVISATWWADINVEDKTLIITEGWWWWWGGGAIAFATSSTAWNVAEKEVSVPSITTLNVWQILCVQPTASATVANLTIKLNNFPAYPIRYNNGAITTTTDDVVWNQNFVSQFVFDGTYRQFVSHWYDNNTTYTQNILFDRGSFVSGSGTYAISRYIICLQKPDMTWEKITNTEEDYSVANNKTVNTHWFLLNGEMLYYSNTTVLANGAVSAANTMYRQNSGFDIRYSMNTTGSGYTAGDYIYLVGTIGADGLFYLDTTQWCTNTLPSTNNGKVYVKVGKYVSGVTITLEIDHPAYYHDGTRIREYVNAENKQDKSNLVTSVSSSSTDSQYPSAKLFYDTCWDIETLINAL